MIKTHDIILALGIASFFVLFVRKGLDWTVDFVLVMFVTISIFNWIQKRIIK